MQQKHYQIDPAFPAMAIRQRRVRREDARTTVFKLDFSPVPPGYSEDIE
jgi:hypothetical protein